MPDIVLIIFATGIVSRLAKSKGYNPVVFGAGTVGLAFLCGFVGAYFFGAAGDILGIFVGGVIMEEITRNMPAKPKPKKRYFALPVTGSRTGRKTSSVNGAGRFCTSSQKL